VGCVAGLDAVAKREITCLCRELNPIRPARRPSPYTDCAARFSMNNKAGKCWKTQTFLL
jgi:hypothetical protein